MLIIESVCQENEHAYFNSSILKYLSIICHSEKVTFCSTSSHYDNLIKINEGLRDVINFKYFKTLKRGKYRDRFNDIRMLMKSLKNEFGAQKIIVLTGSIQNLLAIKILSIFRKNLSISVVLHGELCDLNTKHKNIAKKFFNISNAIKVCSTNNNIRFFVLSDRVFLNLLNDRLIKREKFLSFEPPYDFQIELSEAAAKKKSNKLIISGWGVASVEKGSHKIFELAKLCSAINKFQFTHIGKIVDINFDNFKNNFVKIIGGTYSLDLESFEKHLLKTDIVVLFYPEKLYRYIFSGILYDCIKYEKPILALKNSLFNQFEISINNKIVTQFDSVEEMANFIKNATEEQLKKITSDSKLGFSEIKMKLTSEYFLNSVKALTI